MPRPPILVSVGLLGFVGLAATLSAASAATVQGDGTTSTVACAGDDAVVEGSRNDVTFTGGCRGLVVRGDGNTITVELAPGARLDLQGNANRIRYAIGAPQPMQVSGSSTELLRIAAPPPPPSVPIALIGDGHELDIDCAGRDVVIRGNRSRYLLRGFCRSVTANGDGNRIRAELAAGARATIEGNDTSFVYAVAGGGEADVAVRGAHSVAERAGARANAATASPTPGPLAEAPMPSTVPPKAQPLPVSPAPQDHAVPLPAVPTAPAPPQAAVPAPAENVAIAPGTPRLPALLRLLGARVVANGTSVVIAAEELFPPGADTLRHGGDAKLRQIVQLAGLIHPSTMRLAIIDPVDTGLATRRAETLGTWFGSKGLAVRQADVTTGGTVGAVNVLLAR